MLYDSATLRPSSVTLGSDLSTFLSAFLLFLLFEHHYDYHTTEKFVRIEKGMKKNGM